MQKLIINAWKISVKKKAFSCAKYWSVNNLYGRAMPENKLLVSSKKADSK